VESRSDLALGCRTGEGGGEGSLRGFDIGCTAKSTLVRRFEALTGGDDGGAGRLGVSAAFTLGTGTFPRGIVGVCTGDIFGVCTGGGFGGGLGLIAGADMTGALGLGFLKPSGVLGRATSDVETGTWSDSDEMVMILSG
jgi:hypothetical protein